MMKEEGLADPREGRAVERVQRVTAGKREGINQ